MKFTSDWDAIERDRERKKQLVLQTLQEHCTPSAVAHELQRFCDQPLDITILTGGLANYSYKISLKSDPSIRVFAKLSFDHPICVERNDDDDIPLDASRTEGEYHMMQVFHKIIPECVVQPYLCIDVGPDMKLMVTEWAAADEQFANQFIDGFVDKRSTAKLGYALAKLHLLDFDSDFSGNGMEFQQNLFSSVKVDALDKLFEALDETPANALAHKIGKDDLYVMVDQFTTYMGNDRACLSHNDAQVFNLLVEAKPDVSTLEKFGPDGSLYLVDWEMCHPAPMGKDLGIFWGFPVAAMLCHGMNSNLESVESIWDSLTTMWDAYNEIMVNEGHKSDKDMATTYQTAIGWTGILLILYYGTDFHIDHLPVDNEEERRLFKVHLGKLGLLLLHWGCGDDKGGIEDLNKLCQLEESIRNEILQLKATQVASTHSEPGPRPSKLRLSGRRISDAGLHLGSVTRCYSLRDGNIEELLKEEEKTCV